MNIGKLVLLTATIMLAMALTFSCSSGDDDNGGGNAKNDCIKSELQIKANTLDNVATACDAKRSEVLSQLSDNVGNCNKNDLSFDKTIGNIMSECGASEFPVVGGSSSSGGGRSSSGGDNNNDPFAGIPEWEYYKEFFKYYDPDRDQRCRNGSVEERCKIDGNDVWYSPLTHVCGSEGSESGGSGCFPDGECPPPPPPTYYLGTIERCGNELYPSYQDNIICEPCGSGYYIHYIHNEDYTRCRNGVVEDRCDDTWYNRETHYCGDWNSGTIKAIESCGSWYVRHSDERCNNGVIEERCGYDENAIWYNRITQSCNWNTGIVKAKLRCGS
jgi:hypothetical protein